ncbi:transposase [Nostoc sphaeroides]|uniref:transposase n=1 Tax=Nostoc sphaeroides TaxID=446679 RepID=UPI0022642608|nr:transposase [Nostoc sphaeroides]
MRRKSYSTDLNDSEWAILAPLIPPAKSGGHPRTTDMPEVCNAIYYHLKTGCQWDMQRARLCSQFNCLQLLSQMAKTRYLGANESYFA